VRIRGKNQDKAGTYEHQFYQSSYFPLIWQNSPLFKGFAVYQKEMYAIGTTFIMIPSFRMTSGICSDDIILPIDLKSIAIPPVLMSTSNFKLSWV